MNAPTNAADFKAEAPKATDSKFIGSLLALLLTSAMRRAADEKPAPEPKAENTKSEASGDTLVSDVSKLGVLLLTEMPERLTVEGGEQNPVTTATRVLLEQKYEILAMRKQIEMMQASHLIDVGDSEGPVCVHEVINDLAADLIGKQAVIDFLSEKIGLPTE